MHGLCSVCGVCGVCVMCVVCMECVGWGVWWGRDVCVLFVVGCVWDGVWCVYVCMNVSVYAPVSACM